MASSSIVGTRRNRILRILNDRKDASVDELSAVLNVSPVTIRRDLDYLDRRGSLIRRHGGAQFNDSELPGDRSPDRPEMPETKLEEKDVLNMEEKTRIARRAAKLIRDGDIVFMNSGSTTLALLHALEARTLKIVTNNAAAVLGKKAPGVELMLTGGEYREQSRSLVGEFALKTIKDIYSGYTFLGVNGLTLERGLMTTVYQECSVNQAMIANTHDKVVVVADYTKMGRLSNFISAPIDAVDIIITDDKCPETVRSGFEKMGIEVIIA